MASLSRPKSGSFVVHVTMNGKRYPIRPGTRDVAIAERFRSRVGQVEQALKLGQLITVDMQTWVASLDPVVRRKLTEVFPVLANSKSVSTVGQLTEDFFSRPSDRKPSTVKALKTTAKKVLEFFTSDRPLASITEGHAKDFKAFLRTQEIAPAYVSKIIKKAKQFFRFAVQNRYLERSPFDAVRPGTQINKARQRFISRDDIDRVLGYVSDPSLRAVIILARYGGLRIPSEVQNLQWDDVDYANNRIRIRSPKTEHHEGGEFRDVPIFPELRGVLFPHEDQNGPIVDLSRWPAGNLRKAFRAAIVNAGVKPWPKLFQNLRSTRETELVNSGLPVHVVAAFLGNSPKVAADHYLQVNQSDFDRAIHGKDEPSKSSAQSGALAPSSWAIHQRPGEASENGSMANLVDFVSGLVDLLADAVVKRTDRKWALQGSNL
jgi:integrase